MSSSLIDSTLETTLNAGLLPTTEASNNELGQNEFLELMVAQLQNQDPTKPLDSQQYVAQLAQFSTVESLENIQTSVEQLSASLQSMQALQASSMVGRDVQVSADSGYLGDDKPLSGSVELDDYSDNLTLIVSDSSGREINRVPLGSQPPGTVEFSWDGTDRDGKSMADGVYQIRVEGSVNGEARQFETQVRATVQSVSIGQNGQDVQLSLQGFNKDVGMDQVSAIFS